MTTLNSALFGVLMVPFVASEFHFIACILILNTSVEDIGVLHDSNDVPLSF